MTWKFELQETKEYVQRKSLKSTSKSTILRNLDVWTDLIQNSDVSIHIVICIHMYIYIYLYTLFFEYTEKYVYIYIFIFSDIIYKTPAQRFMLHNFSLHSWCLKKQPGCSSRAFAWLCAVTWGRNAKKIPQLFISSVWSNPVVKKIHVIHQHEILFINMD